MIKTKIIATLGPCCNTADTIRSMVDCGVDVFRLNFSHGTLEKHAELLEQFNTARERHHHTTAVLGDLCGPKIRLGHIDSPGRKIEVGEEITIISGQFKPEAPLIGTTYENFARDVKDGDRILIDDGQIILRALRHEDNKVVCLVEVPGTLKIRKGINLPDSTVSAPSITDNDWQCVDWAIQNNFDFLALSFVRSGDEIRQLKSHIERVGSDIKVIAKIETAAALENLEDIAKASDIILVARGDLGVEVDIARVPLIQKHITHLCRKLGKPVIVATQMLQSMIESPTPTRAEVSDVANAIMDFADAVMLSGETAVGKYPVEAARTICRIAEVTEAYLEEGNVVYPKIDTGQELQLSAAIAHSVAQMTEDIDVRIVAVWSQSGSTARLLSKARIDVPILAFSSNERVCRQMCLHYGVIPRCREIPQDTQEFIHLTDKLILERRWHKPGDKIVLLTGEPIGAADATSAVIVHKLTADN